MTRALVRIVAGYDGTPAGLDALALAELLSRTVGADLVVVRVVPAAREDLGGLTDELSAEVAARLSGSPLRPEVQVLAGRSPARALHELAAADDAVGLVVVGSTHRAGLGRVVPGPVGERLLSGAPCPVAVAPRGYAAPGRTSTGSSLAPAEDLRVVAVAYDASAEAEVALRLASAIALSAEATIRVVAIGTPPAAADLAGSATEAAGEAGTRDLQARLHSAVEALPNKLRALPVYERGDPALRLLARAEEGVDLLVLGSRGYGPMRSVLTGSTSSVVLERSPCPVVVVPRPAIEDDALT